MVFVAIDNLLFAILSANRLSLFHQPFRMDAINLILLLVIVILIISNKASLNQKFYDLEVRLFELQNFVKKAESEKKTS